MNRCADCEHFGNGAFPVVKYYVDGELKSEFVGFSDRPNGEAVECFAHKCEMKTNVICYENSQACKEFTPKTWERPTLCRECSQFKQYYDSGKFQCAGYPFYKLHSNSDKACPNGKERSKQYTLMDFID